MRETWTLTKRELRSYFDGPSAYVILSVFLLFTGWFFGSTLFLENKASLRSMFDIVPFIFLVLHTGDFHAFLFRGTPLGHAGTAAYHAGEGLAGHSRKTIGCGCCF